MTTATEAVTVEVIDGPKKNARPTTDAGGWEHYAYTLRLSYEGRTMETPWKQGTAHTEPPEAADVLESMLSDAAGYENADGVGDWATEYGYDFDEGRKVYEAVEQQTKELRRLLGNDYHRAVFPEGGGASTGAWHLAGEPEPAEGFRLGTAEVYGQRTPVWIEVKLEAGRLSIVGHTLEGGGQNIADAEAVDEFAPGWDEASRDYLVDVWKRWHLNDMNAACEHQRALGWTWETHPLEPCPTCGYKLGTAWLREELPEAVVRWAVYVIANGRPPTNDDERGTE